MNFVGLIPCKTRSQRVFRKNFLRLGGVPLVERAIRYLKAAGIPVWITTDDVRDRELRTITDLLGVPLVPDCPYGAGDGPVWLTHIHAGFTHWHHEAIGMFDYLVCASPDNPFRPDLADALRDVEARRPHEWFTTDRDGRKTGALEIRSWAALKQCMLAGNAIVGQAHPAATDINTPDDWATVQRLWPKFNK